MSAITSMWAWDNPVPASVDARGRGYAPAAPDELVAFARARGLTRVMLSAPWAADEGPVGDWFTAAVDALTRAGVTVSALGGDPGWLGTPQLAVQWSRAARAAGATAIQLDVEPWVLPAWQSDQAGSVRRWLALLDAVRLDVAGAELGIDCPWWLASTTHGDGTVLDAVLPRADRIGVVAFADHAAGPDGIVTLASPAALACGMPFTIGVETDTPEIAGGAQFTFYDEGPDALEREAALVGDAFADVPGYEGVSVEHHRAWRSLLGI
ncbi:hypothetical protein [Cellulomonas sp. PhB150]|uniref:hypothetical protein n=1 Tax=Cellulomonas sp. PhB150 TaxID=2485188 RepID=UPI000F49405F|nr:hypothetical protein [Cellulomonas sp. PhB150]ROS23650.1 hypothetical protein EDF34_2709 [Cellulomonas sp. PhB150]